MPTIIQFLIPAALVLACLIVCRAFIAFRRFLITGAVLGAVSGDSWAFHRYGFCGMPNIIYLLIPTAVILTCVLIYLASTNFRGFLLFGSIHRRDRSRRLAAQHACAGCRHSPGHLVYLARLPQQYRWWFIVQGFCCSFRRP